MKLDLGEFTILIEALKVYRYKETSGNTDIKFPSAIKMIDDLIAKLRCERDKQFRN